MLMESSPSGSRFTPMTLDVGQTLEDCRRKAKYIRSKAVDNNYLDITTQCFVIEDEYSHREGS